MTEERFLDVVLADHTVRHVLDGAPALGVAWSSWKSDSDTMGRTGPKVSSAVILVAAALATASGVLRLI